jgi:uncharacterized protein (DUF4415 family)
MDAAEALFKPAAKKSALLTIAPRTIPGTRETVSIKLDSDVLAFFQQDGPGWQDRINETLREIVKARS